MPSTASNRPTHAAPCVATMPSRHSGAPARRTRVSAPSRCISATDDGKFRCVESVSEGNGERSTAITRRPAFAGAIAAAAPAHRAPGNDALAAELLAFSKEHPLPLREQVLESRMLRERRPIVVRDAINNPLSYKPFITRYGTHSYVAAPIMPEGRVIGFLHGDKGLRNPGDPDGVDELDRDALWAFAEGFGYAVERMQMLERLRAQGEEIRALITRTEAMVSQHLAAQVELASAPLGDAGAARAAAAILPAHRFTVRACDVLRLARFRACRASRRRGR